jgi:hypothetical protein
MKKSVVSLLAVCAVLALAQASPAVGAGRKKATKATPPHHKEPVIASVAANSITVDEEKGTRTFVISQFTEISVNGQKATMSDLKPGMRVNVTIDTDPTRASRVNASGVPVDHDKKKK